MKYAHDGKVQYRRMYNSFIVFWLTVFSMSWYKKKNLSATSPSLFISM